LFRLRGVFLRIVLAFSGQSLMWFWFCLEINILFFLMFVLNKRNLFSREISIKYFLIQSLGSALFLFSLFFFWFSYSFFSEILLLLRIVLKLGIAPLHLWYVRLVEAREWSVILLLSSTQKVIPLIILGITTYNFLFTIIVIRRILVRILGRWFNFKLKTLIAFSSIFILSWLLPICTSLELTIYYLFFYVISLFFLIWSVSEFSVTEVNQLFLIKRSFLVKITMFFSLFSLIGIPPLPIFWAKIELINYLIMINFWRIAILLLMASFFFIYLYLRIFFFVLRKRRSRIRLHLFSSHDITLFNAFVFLTVTILALIII